MDNPEEMSCDDLVGILVWAEDEERVDEVETEVIKRIKNNTFRSAEYIVWISANRVEWDYKNYN